MTIPRFTISAFVVASTVLVASAIAQDIEPGISIEPTDYDFGEIRSGEPIKATFEFTNTGSDALEIVEVRPSCGCTMADWTRDAIEPGDSGHITAEVDTTRLIGPQRQTIDVDISGWNMRAILDSYRLTLRGTVTSGDQ